MSRTRLVAAAVPAIILALLIGCSRECAAPTPSDSKDAHIETFSSDEEALEAAAAALEAYWDALNATYRGEIDDSAAVVNLSTSEWGAAAAEGIAKFHENGLVQNGDVTFAPPTLQQQFAVDGQVVVMVYTCTDFTNRIILDSSGATISQPSELRRETQEVTLKTEVGAESGELFVDRIRPWGDDPC